MLCFAQRPCLPGIHTHAMPVFRPALALRPALIPTWRPCFARHLYSPGGHISTGAPFRLTPCPHDARASPGAHVCLAFAFRPLLRCHWTNAHPMPMLAQRPWFHLVFMHTRRSCSPGAHAPPDARGRSQRHIPCTNFGNKSPMARNVQHA